MNATISSLPSLTRLPNEASTPIGLAIAKIYEEADIPPPSPRYPIAPLGPLLEVLPILCKELLGLTSRTAETYLLQKGSLVEPFEPGVATEEKLSGFLYATATVSCILLRQDDPVVRRRFSLAHELGHIALHVPTYLAQQEDTDTGGFHDLFTEAQIEIESPASSHTDNLAERERQADRFAAELLMPESIVRHLATNAYQEGFHGLGLANRVAMELLVSRAAAGRRLDALGLLGAEHIEVNSVNLREKEEY